MSSDPNVRVRRVYDEQSAADGESACFAHLVCPECGAVTAEGHRPGCKLAATP